jgi:hypothetical protein
VIVRAAACARAVAKIGNTLVLGFRRKRLKQPLFDRPRISAKHPILGVPQSNGRNGLCSTPNFRETPKSLVCRSETVETASFRPAKFAGVLINYGTGLSAREFRWGSICTEFVKS